MLASEQCKRDTIRSNKCWPVSKASETLLGLTNGNLRYIICYGYMLHEPHFSNVGMVIRNVGRVKCQPFIM